MYDGGYPKVVNNGNKPLPIVGEVYRIDSDTLEVLDEYESYPTLYDRKIIAVMVDDIQYDCIIYTYNLSVENEQLVKPINGNYCW